MSDNIKGNCRWDSHDECLLCIVLFPLDIFDRIARMVQLDDGVIIDAENLAVSTCAEQFAAFQINPAICFGDGEEICKTGHFQNFIDLGRGVNQFQIGLQFPQLQKNSQAGRRNVSQFPGIQHHCLCGVCMIMIHNLCFCLRCRSGIDGSLQINCQNLIFAKICLQVHIGVPFKESRDIA